MCQTCGCGQPNDHKHERKDEQRHHQMEQHKLIQINQSVFAANDALATSVQHALDDKKIFCINIMGAPGSGKTTLIEGIAPFLNPKTVLVIQGDLESDIDKRRLEKQGIGTIQINTHTGCHLNAEMINRALIGADLKEKKYLLIENVGNLVCPAGVSLGQHLNMVLSATTEGDDKPEKYPLIFRDAGIIIIAKYDLKEAIEFKEEEYRKQISLLNPKAKILISTKKQKATFETIAHDLSHRREHQFHLDHHHH